MLTFLYLEDDKILNSTNNNPLIIVGIDHATIKGN